MPARFAAEAMADSTSWPVVVLVHSRKGGVGKTSIALSAAIQLATLGKKVGFLELDTLGSHLAQVLPTDRDFEMLSGGRTCRFNPKSFRRRRDGDSSPVTIPAYRDRPNYAWYFPMQRRRHRVPEFAELETRLVIADEVKDRIAAADATAADGLETTQRLETMQRQLGLFLAPSYLTELSVLNDLQLTEQGQAQFREFLSNLVAQFASHQYEYVVVDNSPGISFLAANVLAWALEWVNEKNRKSCHLWYVNTPAWWDMGLTLYESNVYGYLLERSQPTFIINRVRGAWLGIGQFMPGKRVSLRDESQRFVRRIIAQQSMFLPLWQAADIYGADEDRAYKFLPSTAAVAVLGHDEAVHSSMLRETDDGKSELPVDEHAPNLSLEVARTTLTGLANKFLTGFLAPAVDVRPARLAPPTFHDHVRTTLVDHLEGSVPPQTS